MVMTSEPKIAFVQDALPFLGGAEKVLAAALEVFPQAPIYTLVYNRDAFIGTPFENHPVQTSFIDKLPGSHRHHRLFLPLMPVALERFNLNEFDIVLTFSYAVAHAAPTRPDQLHLSYIHTPMRYAWEQQLYPAGSPAFSRLASRSAGLYFKYFRRWDRAMSTRTDHFMTNSQWMATRIWDAYHRPAEVLYPPVDLKQFIPLNQRCDDYVYVGRLVQMKRLDLIVEVFNRLGYPLNIIGEGPEANRLKAIAGPNIRFLGWQPEDRVADVLGRAKAFIHAGIEDFGIALAEAQAAGCPVIAVNRGAAPEIVKDGRTGLLVAEQSVECLYRAVEQFEKQGVSDPPEQIRINTIRFERSRFTQSLEAFVDEKWIAFQENEIARTYTFFTQPRMREAA